MTIIHQPESVLTDRMAERERLRRVIRGLSTGPHRSCGDAEDFARRHGLVVKELGKR